MTSRNFSIGDLTFRGDIRIFFFRYTHFFPRGRTPSRGATMVYDREAAEDREEEVNDATEGRGAHRMRRVLEPILKEFEEYTVKHRVTFNMCVVTPELMLRAHEC